MNVIQYLRMTGATAIVLVTNHVEQTFIINNLMTGKPLALTQDHEDTETWSKNDHGWLMTSTEIATVR